VPVEKPREIAARILRRHEQGAAYAEDLLNTELVKARLQTPDRALIQELVYGVIRWRGALDWLIARKTSGRTQKPALQTLLRLGLYQMFWLDRVPDHAAVNETVALAHLFGLGRQAGFLNAVLRGYGREKATARELLQRLRTEDPPTGHSHPAWCVQRWTARWDASRAARLLDWNNLPPKTYARVNTLRTDPGQLLERWRQEGVDYDFGRWDWVPENLVFELKAHPPLTGLGSLQAGWFYVQDPSTLLAVAMLGPQPGDHVLDLCAAPGGKTTWMAQLMQNQGDIAAEDASPARRQLLEENCSRLGVTCVRVSSPQPATGRPAEGAGFSKALVDAPCSNTGVLRRRVDLRWRLRPEELARLVGTQTALLEQAASRLRPGGTLVYSTCSLEPEENQALVSSFLSRHPEIRFELERELLPFADGVDGAYVARLAKTS
jgi:16S rRNA (cytosine967-C5)-methyltransferase